MKKAKTKFPGNLKYFNITEEERDKILAFQNGVCAICGRPPMLKRRLAIDHRHSDGLIRGNLCWHCNRVLGIFRDNAERFKKAMEYLLDPPAVKALGAARFGMRGRIGTKKSRKLFKKHGILPQ